MKRPWIRIPVSYARSNSGRRLTRSARQSVCAPAVTVTRCGHTRGDDGFRRSAHEVSGFVGDGQTLSTFGAPAFEHNPTILGCHANTKTVRLHAATTVRLVSMLAFHPLVLCRGTLSAVRAAPQSRPHLLRDPLTERSDVSNGLAKPCLVETPILAVAQSECQRRSSGPW